MAQPIVRVTPVRLSLGRRIIHHGVAAIVHARIRVSSVTVRLVNVDGDMVHFVGHPEALGLRVMKGHAYYEIN